MSLFRCMSGGGKSDYWTDIGFYNLKDELPTGITISQILNASIIDGIISITGQTGNGVCIDNDTGKTIEFNVFGSGAIQWGYGTYTGSLPTYNTTGANRNSFNNVTLSNNIQHYTVPTGKRFYISSQGNSSVNCNLFLRIPTE